MLHQYTALGGAFLISLMVTPLFRMIALRFGLVDKPDPNRKLHREPVAVSGGIAVFISCALAATIALLAHPDFRTAMLAMPWDGFGFGLACLAIVVLGFIDDVRPLRGHNKLLGQLLIVSGLVACGFRMEAVSVLGLNVDLGALSFVVSVCWLLLTVNALNLIDGADGLCSSVGWIASAGIAAMATIGHQTAEATIAAGLAGALLGFLVFNFPPAKIFLGDAGSMLIGLILGALAIRTTLKGATAVSLLGPVAILAIPIFDSSMAILRRKLTGRSIFAVDRGHLHHNLLHKGLGNRGLVAMITLLCGILAVGAFLGSALNNELIAFLSITVVLGSLVASRVFGFAELVLLGNRMAHLGGHLMAKNGRSENLIRQQVVRIQGHRSWDTVWATLTEFADKHDLVKVCFDLNVPWLHEAFHATWQKSKAPDHHHRWSTKLPVVANGRLLARLEIVGNLIDENVVEVLGQLAEMLESLQPDLERLTRDVPVSVISPLSEEPVAIVSELSERVG